MNAPLPTSSLVDPILQELWEVKDRLAKQHHNSTREIVENTQPVLQHTRVQNTPLRTER
jgi:hypothetical protein